MLGARRAVSPVILSSLHSIVGLSRSVSYIEKRESVRPPSNLVDLLLLVHAQLAGAHVDQEEQTTTGKLLELDLAWDWEYIHNRQDLEEVVLGKVLVRVVGVQLGIVSNQTSKYS